MCSDRNNIYVFGGKPDDMSAHKFDVCHGIWSSLPEMNRRRRCTGNLLFLVSLFFVVFFLSVVFLSCITFWRFLFELLVLLLFFRFKTRRPLSTNCHFVFYSGSLFLKRCSLVLSFLKRQMPIE